MTLEKKMFHTSPMNVSIPIRLLENIDRCMDEINMLYYPCMSGDSRNVKQLVKANSMGSIKNAVDKFQINLDVKHFAPDEITVKLIEGFIVVEGQHDEREDQHGLVSRKFVRRYVLPEGCQKDLVECRISSDGVLTVTAPFSAALNAEEKIIPISLTGPVRKDLKQDLPKEDQPQQA